MKDSRRATQQRVGLDFQAAVELIDQVCARWTKDFAVPATLVFAQTWGRSVTIRRTLPQPSWEDLAEYPFLNPNPGPLDIAQLRFDQPSGTWRLYWMRKSGRRWPYEPEDPDDPGVANIGVLLQALVDDHWGCFWAFDQGPVRKAHRAS